MTDESINRVGLIFVVDDDEKKEDSAHDIGFLYYSNIRISLLLLFSVRIDPKRKRESMTHHSKDMCNPLFLYSLHRRPHFCFSFWVMILPNTCRPLFWLILLLLYSSRTRHFRSWLLGGGGLSTFRANGPCENRVDPWGFLVTKTLSFLFQTVGGRIGREGSSGIRPIQSPARSEFNSIGFFKCQRQLHGQ